MAELIDVTRILTKIELSLRCCSGLDKSNTEVLSARAGFKMTSKLRANLSVICKDGGSVMKTVMSSLVTALVMICLLYTSDAADE